MILALLLGFSSTPFVLSAIHVAAQHETFLGVSGVFPFDQDQYLAYVANAHDGLIGNLYGVFGGRVFVDPVWSPSGIVAALTGVSPAAILAFWNVVGTSTLFAGAWRLVARHVAADQPWRRCVALLLALFGDMTLLVAIGRPLHVSVYASVGLDFVPADTLWGYAPMAIAIGLMPFAIEGMERILDARAGRGWFALTVAVSLLIGWLHPWQGATLLIIWTGLLAWHARDRGLHSLIQWRLALVCLALASGPAYFQILPHVDASWARFSKADAAGFALSWRYLVLALVPALIAGLPGSAAMLRKRSARGLLLWPVAVLVLIAAQPPETLHSFDGLALPIGVLTVLGARHLRAETVRQRVITLFTSAWVVFVLFSAVWTSIALVEYTQDSWVEPLSAVKPDNERAVRLAATLAAGYPILTSQELGVQVPIIADTATWVGDGFWTPSVTNREMAADRFFLGDETPAAGRQFVRRTRARAIVEPCGWKFNLAGTLSAPEYHERTVGCAHVYWRY